MSKNKHTPGPWFAEGHSVFTKQGAYHIAEMRSQAYRQSFVRPTLEASANAQLIAAAPELLEALEAVAEALKSRLEELNLDHKKSIDLLDAKNAIRKAKGA